jgi:hypothetical protein
VAPESRVVELHIWLAAGRVECNTKQRYTLIVRFIGGMKEIEILSNQLTALPALAAICPKHREFVCVGHRNSIFADGLILTAEAYRLKHEWWSLCFW